MENGTFHELLDTFMKYKGCGFVSLQYRNKQGELSKRLMNIGAEVANAKKDDLKTIANGITYVPSINYTKAVWDIGMAEMKQSCIKNPNENYSNGQLNAYAKLNEENGSVRYNFNTQQIYLFGKSEHKEILEHGVYKAVKSSAKTLAKKEIGKALKNTKFRTLILSNLCGTVKVNKQIIIIDGEERIEDVIEFVGEVG